MKTLYKTGLIIFLVILIGVVVTAIQIQMDDKFIVTPDGEVGIGTMSPNSNLHIIRENNEELILLSGINNPRYAVGIGSTHILNVGERLDFYTGDTGANNQKHASSQVRMSITADGKVGIGDTNPGTTLDVAGNIYANKITRESPSNALVLEGSGGANIELYGSDASGNEKRAYYDAAVHSFRDSGAFPTFMTITNGSVGIGTSSPTKKLDVAGGVKADEYCIGNDCRSFWSLSTNSCTRKNVSGSGGSAESLQVCNTTEIIISGGAECNNADIKRSFPESDMRSWYIECSSDSAKTAHGICCAVS